MQSSRIRPELDTSKTIQLHVSSTRLRKAILEAPLHLITNEHDVANLHRWLERRLATSSVLC